jgi:hypothetical protein
MSRTDASSIYHVLCNYLCMYAAGAGLLAETPHRTTPHVQVPHPRPHPAPMTVGLAASSDPPA